MRKKLKLEMKTININKSHALIFHLSSFQPFHVFSAFFLSIGGKKIYNFLFGGIFQKITPVTTF